MSLKSTKVRTCSDNKKDGFLKYLKFDISESIRNVFTTQFRETLKETQMQLDKDRALQLIKTRGIKEGAPPPPPTHTHFFLSERKILV